MDFNALSAVHGHLRKNCRKQVQDLQGICTKKERKKERKKKKKKKKNERKEKKKEEKTNRIKNKRKNRGKADTPVIRLSQRALFP